MNTCKENRLIDNFINYILKNSLYKQSEFEKIQASSEKDSRFRFEDIDIGVSGIILFLIDSYKVKKSQIIKEALIESAENLIIQCNNKVRSHFGFFKGRSGVCFTLLKIGKVINDERYANYCFEKVRNNCDSFIDSDYATNNLYDGRSGLLIFLLHLYSIRSEKWILDMMQRCLKKIVESFLPTQDGIIWNRRDSNIKPLISYLYGSSGVTFALNQYGVYFNNKIIVNLAKEIAYYEDNYLHRSSLCWPDFKKEIASSEEFKNHFNKFLSNEESFFLKPELVHDIENGTAGICLARYTLMNSEDKSFCADNIQNILKKLCLFNSKKTSFINGIAGVGESLLISTKYCCINDCLKRYKTIACQLSSEELSFGDISLFNGITGTAYFLLHAGNPDNFDSVSFPIVDKRNQKKPIVDLEYLNSNFISDIFNSCYPHTSLTYRVSDPVSYSNLDFKGYENSGMLLAGFISNIILLSLKDAPHQVRELVLDIFNLETAKINMLKAVKSNSLYNIRRIHEFVKKKSLLNMSEEELAEQSLVFNNETVTIKTRWNWAKLDTPMADNSRMITEFLSSKPERLKLIIFRDIGIQTVELDTMGSLTKSIFKKPIKVCDALKGYLDNIETKNEFERKKLRKYVMEYIIYYIRQSLLESNP